MRITFSIISFFLFLTVFSQTKIENLTNITLSKIYNEPDDGSCNSFLSKESADVVSRKINDCDDLVLDLINLKSNLKFRKSDDLCCRLESLGCPSLQFMVTYQFNKLVDTLYFNKYENENFIIDWKSKRQFDDKNRDITKILNKAQIFKNLIDINLDKIFRETFEFSKSDSLDLKSLKINDNQFYGLNRSRIDSLIGGFGNYIEIERDIRDNKDSFKYYGYNQDSYNEYYFINDSPLYEIIINKIEDEEDYYLDKTMFNINGIRLNDSEKLLIEKFPNSTKYIENKKEYFKDENGDYTITVMINDEKGGIDFILNNGKLKQIKIYFKYSKH
jgi:hypothetical protein